MGKGLERKGKTRERTLMKQFVHCDLDKAKPILRGNSKTTNCIMSSERSSEESKDADEEENMQYPSSSSHPRDMIPPQRQGPPSTSSHFDAEAINAEAINAEQAYYDDLRMHVRRIRNNWVYYDHINAFIRDGLRAETIFSRYEMPLVIPLRFGEFYSVFDAIIPFPYEPEHEPEVEPDSEEEEAPNYEREITRLSMAAYLYRRYRNQIHLLDCPTIHSGLSHLFMEGNQDRNYSPAWRYIQRRIEKRCYNLRDRIYEYCEKFLLFPYVENANVDDIVEEQNTIAERSGSFQEILEEFRRDAGVDCVSFRLIDVLLDILPYEEPPMMMRVMMLIMQLLMCFFDETSDPALLNHN